MKIRPWAFRAALFFLCLTVLAQEGGAGAAEGPLTLERALLLARQHNPTLQAAREQVAQASADVTEAASAFGPTVKAQLSYTHYDEMQKTPVEVQVANPDDPGSGLPGSGYAFQAFQNTWQSALTLTQVLSSGGSITAGHTAAKLQQQAQKATEARTLQSVENGVAHAYYGLQRARAARGVAEEALDLAREHRDQVQSMLDHGVVAKNELLRAQVDVADAELQLIEADNAVQLTWEGLSRAVGLPFEGKPPLPEPRESVPGFAVPGNPVERALEGRPEMQVLGLSRRAVLKGAEAAAGQARPQISLQGKYQEVGDSFYPQAKDTWSITLVAQWILYDHGEIEAQVEKARARAREFLSRLEELKNQIRQEVATARLNLESSLQRLNVARNQVELAREDYRMAQKRYRVQVGTNLDVLDARVGLNSARTQQVNAVYDAYTAWADLRYALGRSPGGWREGR